VFAACDDTPSEPNANEGMYIYSDYVREVGFKYTQRECFLWVDLKPISSVYITHSYDADGNFNGWEANGSSYHMFKLSFNNSKIRIYDIEDETIKQALQGLKFFDLTNIKNEYLAYEPSGVYKYSDNNIGNIAFRFTHWWNTNYNADIYGQRECNGGFSISNTQSSSNAIKYKKDPNRVYQCVGGWEPNLDYEDYWSHTQRDVFKIQFFYEEGKVKVFDITDAYVLGLFKGQTSLILTLDPKSKY